MSPTRKTRLLSIRVRVVLKCNEPGQRAVWFRHPAAAFPYCCVPFRTPRGTCRPAHATHTPRVVRACNKGVSPLGTPCQRHVSPTRVHGRYGFIGATAALGAVCVAQLAADGHPALRAAGPRRELYRQHLAASLALCGPWPPPGKTRVTASEVPRGYASLPRVCRGPPDQGPPYVKG